MGTAREVERFVGTQVERLRHFVGTEDERLKGLYAHRMRG
jgi:hypothetical protein